MSIRTLDGFEVRGNPTDEEMHAAVTALLASFAAAGQNAACPRPAP
ncbi:acyl-CoA carboxylase subunit epsilon, partial [Actinospica sp. MGRD01-02]|nr:acyl-CoA carboxylase subunit epsilon [Actinospica acidithermotolerans]